jgi:hypothetical protein
MTDRYRHLSEKVMVADLALVDGYLARLAATVAAGGG